MTKHSKLLSAVSLQVVKTEKHHVASAETSGLALGDGSVGPEFRPPATTES